MTLDEAIKHAEEVAEKNQRVVDTGIVFDDVTIDMLYCDDTEVIEEHLANYKSCANEHRQLAEWLKDYKRLLEQESCEDWYDVPSNEMTVEQARQAVKDLRKKLAEHLEQEPCEDAISRQAVKRILEDRFMELQKRHDDKRYETNYCLNTILDLPPVNPQPNIGHWIDIMVGDMPAQACDQCNTFYPLAYTGGGHNYCPNCGAKMVKPQESEEISERNMKMWEEILKAESEG